jgi:glycosyltransferase involved in cell wall biosynthesis
MRLIYAASIAFSDKLANRVQIRVMAEEFQKKLGDNFWLGVNYKNVEDENLNIVCFDSGKSRVLAWRCLKFIKKNNIANVYCREARMLFFIILFNKLFFHLKLKFIYEIHALVRRNLIDKIVESFIARQCDRYIFITKNLKDIYAKKYNLDFKKTIVAADAVDLKIFDLDLTKEQARVKLGLPRNKRIIGYCGKFKTMGMDKGISDILRAVKILNDPNILFVAIGGSEKDLDFYRNEAEKLGVQESVEFIGAAKQSDLAVFQKACDVLLMPFPDKEHYAYYMSPLKMFEYMASKRPIIATDLPSIREVLSESNAIIVKPDNPGDLARGVKKVLEDDKLSDEIAGKAYEDAKNYTWEKRVKKIIDFIF